MSDRRTPAQCTFGTDQPVTQWNVVTCSARGSARRCSIVSDTGFWTSPPTRRRHVAGSKVGIESETV